MLNKADFSKISKRVPRAEPLALLLKRHNLADKEVSANLEILEGVKACAGG